MNEGHELEKELCEKCHEKIAALRKPWVSKQRAAAKSLMILNACPQCKERMMAKAWSMKR